MKLDAYGSALSDADLATLAESSTPRVRRRRSGAEFLCGPVPLDWLREAAGLRGRALAVGLAIWFRVGIEKGRRVRLTSSTLAKLGIVERTSAYRGLAALERAGLVHVERAVGRAPIVSIRDPKPSTTSTRPASKGDFTP